MTAVMGIPAGMKKTHHHPQRQLQGLPEGGDRLQQATLEMFPVKEEGQEAPRNNTGTGLELLPFTKLGVTREALSFTSRNVLSSAWSMK